MRGQQGREQKGREEKRTDRRWVHTGRVAGEVWLDGEESEEDRACREEVGVERG